MMKLLDTTGLSPKKNYLWLWVTPQSRAVGTGSNPSLWALRPL
jgi:hypothetical protein